MAWYGSPLISHRLIPKDQLLFMASASHPLNLKPPKFILQRSFCGSNNKIPQSQPCWWWIQGDCWSETRPINRLIAEIVILGDGILERLRLSIALLPRLVILRDAICGRRNPTAGSNGTLALSDSQQTLLREQ